MIKALRDLTYEVLTHHGMTPKLSYGYVVVGSPRGLNVSRAEPLASTTCFVGKAPRVDVVALHSDLVGIGWSAEHNLFGKKVVYRAGRGDFFKAMRAGKGKIKYAVPAVETDRVSMTLSGTDVEVAY